MKKTLMVLTFALCATFVFAQNATPRMRGEYKAPAKAAQVQNDYRSSVFTKDVTLYTCDFHAADEGYSTGIVLGGLEGHAENYDYATWQRIANSDSLTFVQIATTYAALAQNYFGGVQYFASYMPRYVDSTVSSSENGFMMMSLYDQRTPNSGNFNAYILFQNIDASNAPRVDVNFYQYYRKYYDNCYLDYSTDGTNWNEMEINTTGVDISVNGTLRGFITYYLPTATGYASNLSVRVRYKSLDADRLDYGYFWCIDDVSFIAGADNRLLKFSEEYVEGNYGMIPQGMEINPAWYSNIRNIGTFSQNNANAKLYHLPATMDVATEIGSYNNGNIAVDQTKPMVSDRSGWILLDSLEYRGWYGYIDHTPHGSGVALPTETAGDNYIYAALQTDSLTITYDTHYYQVTTPHDANGIRYRWAHDNGVLTYSPYNYWLFGYVYEAPYWFVTEDPEKVQYYNPGYTVTSRFTTDANVPSDWVIQGVELVASPVSGYYNTGSRISGVLYYDDYDGGEVNFRTMNTGANVKEITSSDVNDSNIIGRNTAGYLTSGNYNTIFIEFPEQPALEPNMSYRIGYAMEEEGYFALAAEALGSYRMALPSNPTTMDTIIYFANDPATAKYATRYTVNQYQTYVMDPIYRSTFGSWYVDYNPMIRMIVGPRQEVERHDIEVSCEAEEYGEVVYAGVGACGETIHPVHGSTATITGVSYRDCVVSKVIVDGTEVQPWNEDEETGDYYLRVTYNEEDNSYAYQYSFANIQENHTIQFEFAQGQQGIDPVAANVHMNLQPNPATSQVNLNIEGVAGMVNCMLIDMSGRVVYNQNINAEVTQTINLSNLAKGAYFVRITNDKFSKVEKLIVR